MPKEIVELEHGRGQTTLAGAQLTMECDMAILAAICALMLCIGIGNGPFATKEGPASVDFGFGVTGGCVVAERELGSLKDWVEFPTPAGVSRIPYWRDWCGHGELGCRKHETRESDVLCVRERAEFAG